MQVKHSKATLTTIDKQNDALLAKLAEVEAKAKAMRTIRVTFEDGNTITTNINGTDEEIRRYYIGQSFNFGDTQEHPKDKMVKAISVEFLT